jgi:hypothetical protein
MAEDQHREAWEDEAPKLASLKGNWQPKAPEGYFDSFPEKLMQRIQEEAAPVQPALGSAKRMGWGKWVGGAAAAVLLAVGLWWTLKPDTHSLSSHEMLAEAHTLTSEELIHAVDFVGIETSEILEAMGDEALSAINLTQASDPADLNDYLNGQPLPPIDWEDLDLPDSAILEHLNI